VAGNCALSPQARPGRRGAAWGPHFPPLVATGLDRQRPRGPPVRARPEQGRELARSPSPHGREFPESDLDGGGA
jgi:hypothetical protein